MSFLFFEDTVTKSRPVLFFILSSPCASDTATTQRMCQNIPFTWTDLVLKCVLQDILKEEKQEKGNQPNKAPSGGEMGRQTK